MSNLSDWSFSHFWQAFIFPDFCQNCQKLGPILCESCYQLVEFFWQEDLTQLFCKNFTQVYFDQVKIMASFKKPLSSLIKSLKYQHHSRAAKFLAQMLFFHVYIDYQEIDYISFIPIHPQKNKKRGYNQSQLIAQELALWAKKPCKNFLLKNKNTKAQAQITDKKSRLARLNHNFAIVPEYKNSLVNRKILLIDDVITTAATINSACQILKENGARTIIALALGAKL